MLNRLLKTSRALGGAATLLSGAIAFAQETAPAVEAPAADAAAAVADTMDKGDTACMIISTMLVLFMILPGLALFYGGLVRAKNMLSVLMQCMMITAVVIVIWVVYGYSLRLRRRRQPVVGRHRPRCSSPASR